MTGQNGTPKLTPHQRKAIVALVATPTVEEAARAARVSRSRLYVWLQDRTFAAAVEQARREQAQETLDFLRSSMLKAVRKLSELLDSRSEAIAHKAAVAILDLGFRGVEIAELKERLAMLERLCVEAQHAQHRA